MNKGKKELKKKELNNIYKILTGNELQPYQKAILDSFLPTVSSLNCVTSIHEMHCELCAIELFDMLSAKGMKLNLVTGEFYA